MSALADKQTSDLKSLRDKNRALRRELAEIVEIVRDNDATVALQHQLALLLINRPRDWHRRAETLLRRGMQATSCQLVILKSATRSQQMRTLRKLPAGGQALPQPLIARKNTKGDYIYYHLPLRRQSKTIGVLILTMRQANLRDGDDALCKRLSALLAAAI